MYARSVLRVRLACAPGLASVALRSKGVPPSERKMVTYCRGRGLTGAVVGLLVVLQACILLRQGRRPAIDPCRCAKPISGICSKAAIGIPEAALQKLQSAQFILFSRTRPVGKKRRPPPYLELYPKAKYRDTFHETSYDIID